MLADESLNHLDDRKEVYNQQNKFGIDEIKIPEKKTPAI
jgi:hypothetical protein